jgi:protein TonB
MRKQRYSVRMHLWIEHDGRIKRFELLDTTGDAGMDTLLRTSLASLDRIRERPPEDLPQPVRIRVTSRL